MGFDESLGAFLLRRYTANGVGCGVHLAGRGGGTFCGALAEFALAFYKGVVEVALLVDHRRTSPRDRADETEIGQLLGHVVCLARCDTQISGRPSDGPARE